MLELNKHYCGDSTLIMKNIPDNYIDLTLTSPPYDSLRSYNNLIKNDITYDTFSFPFIDIAKELFRITKNGGIVVWVVNDQVKKGGETGSSFRQALKFQEIGFKIYDTMIYHKNGAPFPESGRYSQVFEYMFVFLKGDKPNTVNLLKDKPNKWAGSSTFGKRSSRQQDGTLKEGNSFIVSDYGYRYNVWHINNGAGYTTKDKYAYEHPGIFPESLAEDHILSWTNEKDIVLDPLVGSGTVSKMAKLNNRDFIGIDISQEYIDIANRRIDVVPYDEKNINPKTKFLISKEEILKKRKKKK
jgi:DNA modification methylase